MKAIGGYFELELRKGSEYHCDAIRLNTGRNSLEFILRIRKYCKVFIPYYTCETVLEPFNKLGVDYEFYSINEKLEPDFDYNKVKADYGFLYTNYFGLKDSFIYELAKIQKNLIIDNAQSFFSKPINGVDTFYSVRKFFGVPDGAYLYINNSNKIDIPDDHSENRFVHLLKRIEYGAEEGYQDFKLNDNNLIGHPIKRMSNITKALLCNIDYDLVMNKRKKNFLILDKNLSILNELTFKLDAKSVPMIYPLLVNNANIRQLLIDNKIFVPTYWPNVLDWAPNKSFETRLAKEVIPLPIDQRYSIDEMEHIVKTIINAN